jgi:hypothetical protein
MATEHNGMYSIKMTVCFIFHNAIKCALIFTTYVLYEGVYGFYKNSIAMNAVCMSFNENRHILSHHYQFLCYVSTTVNVPLKNNETKPVFLWYDYN